MNYKKLTFSCLSQSSYYIVNRALGKIIGLNPAILLSNLISHQQNLESTEQVKCEWFYYLNKYIIENTLLTNKQIRLAKLKLIKLNILEYKKIGCPAKVYYKLNHEMIIKTMEEEGPHKYPPKGLFLRGAKGHVINIKTNDNIKTNEIKKNTSKDVLEVPSGKPFSTTCQDDLSNKNNSCQSKEFGTEPLNKNNQPKELNNKATRKNNNKAYKINRRTKELINYWNEKTKELTTKIKPSVHNFKTDDKNLIINKPTKIIKEIDAKIKSVFDGTFNNNYEIKNKSTNTKKIDVKFFKTIIDQYLLLFTGGHSYNSYQINIDKLTKSFSDFIFNPATNLSYFFTIVDNPVKPLSEKIEKTTKLEMKESIAQQYIELLPEGYYSKNKNNVDKLLNKLHEANINISYTSYITHTNESGWSKFINQKKSFFDYHIEFLKSFKNITYGHLRLDGELFKILNDKSNKDYQVDWYPLISRDIIKAYEGRIFRLDKQHTNFAIDDFWYTPDFVHIIDADNHLKKEFYRRLEAGEIKDKHLYSKLCRVRNDETDKWTKKFNEIGLDIKPYTVKQ